MNFASGVDYAMHLDSYTFFKEISGDWCFYIPEKYKYYILNLSLCPVLFVLPEIHCVSSAGTLFATQDRKGTNLLHF